MTTTIPQSIWTPFNRRETKSTIETRRVLKDGRWVKPDPKASAAMRWLKGEGR